MCSLDKDESNEAVAEIRALDHGERVSTKVDLILLDCTRSDRLISHQILMSEVKRNHGSLYTFMTYRMSKLYLESSKI